MAFNDYIDSTYTVTSYFTGDAVINGIEGNGELVSVVSFTAELSPADMSYIDPTYIEAGYFEGTEVVGGIQEGGATLTSQSTIFAISNKAHSASANLISQVDEYVVPYKIVEVNASIVSEDTFSIYVQAVREYELMAFTDATMSISAGKLVSGSVIVPGEQTYVDGTYIEGGYFVLGIGIMPVITTTLSALGGKVQSVTTDIIVSGQYVDPTYLEQGYFEGTVLYGVIGAFSVTAELDAYVVPGQLFGSAYISANFTLEATATEITAPQEAYATLLSSVSVSSTAALFRDYDADISTSFNASANATNALGFSSSLDITSSTTSTAVRTRGYNSSIQAETSVSTINARIRDTNSQMSVQFQTTTLGQRARAIDLYAFTSGGLVAQANVIRDSNTLANTFFNVGTDFIRTRNVSAEGDATVFISNIPTRIRASNIETQDAFSFASFAVATRDIDESIVSTFVIENAFELVRGYTANVSIQTTLEITANVTRDFNSSVSVVLEQTTIPSITRDVVSTQTSTFITNGVISAIFGCDMNAFDDAEVITQSNGLFRGSCDMFSMPGGRLYCDFTRARTFIVSVNTMFLSNAEGVKIHPFVAEPFEVICDATSTAVKIHSAGSLMYLFDAYAEANGVVRFYFFPTDFSFAVLDEPLADTLTSRTRETGVNI